jgi:nitrite reductase (NADH) large subunit
MPEIRLKAWICTVCGYIHHGLESPAECPDCGAGSDMFEPYADLEMTKTAQEPTVKRYLIVGSGIAGISAADAIHKSDPDAFVQVLTSEHELPYYRMNLTRYLAGEIDKTKLDLHPTDWYVHNHIKLELDTTVQAILPEEKVLVLEDQNRVPYDKLILAVGASPFVPPFKGVNLKHVLTIRTIHDTDILLSACSEPIQVICIGGGLLGLEIAGAINRRGAQVTVIESLPWLLPRQLDRAASLIMQDKILAMGISVLTGAKTQALLGEDKIEGLLLEDGRKIKADMVVISAGVSANIVLARQAGLTVNRGIIVDDHMLTSHPDIYAVGDATEHNGRLYGLWVPAKSQGTIAGLAAAGQDVLFHDLPPSARLKVLGIDLFSIGQFTPQDDEDKLISEAKDGNYASFVFRQGVMIGSILLGDASLASYVKTAVEEKVDFSSQLADGISMDDLIKIIKSP